MNRSEVVLDITGQTLMGRNTQRFSHAKRTLKIVTKNKLIK